MPNYAFPRRASNAYFTDRKEAIQRAPAIALRELAPLSSVYFRGKRYTIVKAQPRARGGAQHWSRIKVCACGRFYMNDEIATAGACKVCDSDLMGCHEYGFALELPDAVARPAGRISSDEDDRTKRGFDIKPYFRLGHANVSALARTNEELATVRYVKRGELVLGNHGLRRSDTPRLHVLREVPDLDQRRRRGRPPPR